MDTNRDFLNPLKNKKTTSDLFGNFNNSRFGLSNKGGIFKKYFVILPICKI